MICSNTRRRQILLTHEGYSVYWRGYWRCIRETWHWCPGRNDDPPCLRRSSLVTECALKGGIHKELWRRKEIPMVHCLRPQGCWDYGHWLYLLNCILWRGGLYAPLQICSFKMSSVVSDPKKKDGHCGAVSQFWTPSNELLSITVLTREEVKITSTPWLQQADVPNDPFSLFPFH